MSFTKNKSYWQHRLKTINEAIKGNLDRYDRTGAEAALQYATELREKRKEIKSELRKSKEVK